MTGSCPSSKLTPSDEGLYRSYAEVIERVGRPELRLLLYHFPKQTCIPLSHALVDRLCASFPDTIGGLKDSTGDEASTRAFIERFTRLRVFAGSETVLLPALAAGGAGCIAAAANVSAPAIRAVYDAWQRGGAKAAGEAARSARRDRDAIAGKPLVPALKQIVSQRRGDSGWRRVRPPLVAR